MCILLYAKSIRLISTNSVNSSSGYMAVMLIRL